MLCTDWEEEEGLTWIVTFKFDLILLYLIEKKKFRTARLIFCEV